MNLFINAVLSKGALIIFNNDRKIIVKEEIEVLGNESSKLVGKVDEFLKNNSIIYENLDNIIVVNGPGSFTGIRTISLLVNTINYVTKKSITPISFFDLFSNYPICKPSSKRDTFFKKNENSEVEIIMNDDLKKYFEDNNISKIYGELNSQFFTDIETLDLIDYENIIRDVELKNEEIIKPLYIKKPNIS